MTNFQYIQTICTTTRHSLVIFFNFWRTSFLFVVPLIPLCWTSGDVCPGFQSQSATPCLCTSSTVHNGFLRFTSGVTAADFLFDSMAADPLWSTYLYTYNTIKMIQESRWEKTSCTFSENLVSLADGQSRIDKSVNSWWNSTEILSTTGKLHYRPQTKFGAR